MRVIVPGACGAIAFSVLALVAGAQDAAKPAAAPPPASRTPAQAWAVIRAAYATNPTAERVTVAFVGADGSAKGAEHFDTKLDPRAGNPAGPRLRLDLGSARLVAGDGRMVVTHVLSREGAFVAEGLATPLTTATIASLLPPLPLPALAALTTSEAPTDAAGYLRPIEWSEVTPDTGGAFAIIGQSHGVQIRVIAGVGGRLRSLTLSNLPSGGSIVAEFAAQAPPTPADFDLGADGWPRVATIRDLFSLPPTPVEPGQPVPELTVQDERAEPLLLSEALARVAPARVRRADASVDTEQNPPAAERVVLVIHRLPADPAASEHPSPALAAARGALAETLFRSERDRFLNRAVAATEGSPTRLPPTSGAVVLVADLGEGNSPLRVDRARGALAAQALPAASADFAPRVFQAVSAIGMMGPFILNAAPGSTLVVTLTGDWRLIGVDAWPDGATAAQGAALVQKRLRAQQP